MCNAQVPDQEFALNGSGDGQGHHERGVLETKKALRKKSSVKGSGITSMFRNLYSV